jgi:hypothetical protein
LPYDRELLAGSVGRRPPAATPVTNEKYNGSNAEQQYWNRSQANRFKVGEIGEGIPGWIKWVAKDGDLLSDSEFLPRAFPANTGFVIHRKAGTEPVAHLSDSHGRRPRCIPCSRPSAMPESA